MRALNTRNQQVLAQQLRIAESFSSRLIGLMGQKTFSDGEGLLIKRSGNSIHTFFMNFPIDLLFLDRAGKVRWITHHAKQWRVFVAPVLASTDCLELPSGTLERTQTQIGDTIRVES